MTYRLTSSASAWLRNQQPHRFNGQPDLLLLEVHDGECLPLGVDHGHRVGRRYTADQRQAQQAEKQLLHRALRVATQRGAA